jgi:hypothetical protein
MRWAMTAHLWQTKGILKRRNPFNVKSGAGLNTIVVFFVGLDIAGIVGFEKALRKRVHPVVRTAADEEGQ